MAFMQRQVQYGEWIEVECAGSTCVFPANMVDDPDKHWDDDAEKFDGDYLANVASISARASTRTSLRTLPASRRPRATAG